MTHDFKSAKQKFEPYLRGAGFIPRPSKRIWAYDGKFYLIVLELAPCHLGGFFTNLGVSFLWNKPEAAWDFYYFEYANYHWHRLYTEHTNIGGSILYESPNFEAQIDEMIQVLALQVEEYKKLSDLDYLAEKLRNRRDLFWSQHQKDCNMADDSLGIVQMLRGKSDEAKAIFQYNYHAPSGWAIEYLQHCDSTEAFKTYITQKIMEYRVLYAAKYKYRLPVIEEIFPACFYDARV